MGLQRQGAEINLPQSAVDAALQRQQAVPAPVPTRPQSISDWVTVMRFQAEQSEGRRMGAKEAAQFTALQRQVTQTMSRSYLTDRQSAMQRQQDYAGHVVALQRHPVSGQVARAFMLSVPQGERATLQRAVDETKLNELIQRQQDEQALKLHTLQRQLAELNEQATQPVFERIQQRRGAGNPLPEAIQRHLEQGLNHDLSAVRIHDDAEADKLAKGVNAIAFTTGTDIYFQSGKFNPNSQSGLELLAHEVTHTVQQSKGQVGKGVDPDSGLESEARNMGKKLSVRPQANQNTRQRHSPTRPAFTPTTTFQRQTVVKPLKPPANLTVGKIGVIKHTDGANLRAQPNPKGPLLQPKPVPPGTKVGVISQTADGWSKISLSNGKTGFVQTVRVTTDLPDPGSTLVKIPPGSTAIGIAERYYKSVIKPGQDLRFYVNVLERVNRDRGTGAFQGGQVLKGGNLLWIPSPAYAQTLKGTVEDGSITNGALAKANALMGNSPGANIMRSVLESPTHIKEVLGDTWKVVEKHWPAMLGTTLAFISAEVLVGVLAAAPEPTTITKFAAVGLQGLITAAAGAGAIMAGTAALKSAEAWLRTAWTAGGNASKIKAASKAFLQMIGNLALAVASAAGAKASVNGMKTPLSMVTRESLIARIGSPKAYNQLMQLTGGNTKFLAKLLDYGFRSDEMLALLKTPGANVKQVETILSACQKHGIGIDDFRSIWAFKKPLPDEFPDKSKFPWPPNNGAIGKTKVQKVEAGTLLDRYGHEGGRFVGYAGRVQGKAGYQYQPATFSQRALPQAPDESQYHVYQVIKAFEVESAEIAPWFGEPGGGVQALSTQKSIAQLLEGGFIKEITKEVKP